MILKPMKHQLKTMKLMDSTDILYDMSDPGTGKTFVQISAYIKRIKKDPHCALIIAPKTLLRTTWEDEFKKLAPQIVCSVAVAENREKAFAAKADVYITNTDAVVWLVKQKPAFFKRFGTLVIDEVSSFKHVTSGRSKALNKIKKYFKYRSVLSGTPNSNTICDVHNPVAILDDGKRLGQSFYGFRSSVCAPEQIGPSPNMLKWHDKEGAEEVVYGLIADITIRHKFSDCIDIPETSHRSLTYHLTTKQKKVYLDMEKTQVALLKKDIVVSAINAAVVANKLLQIASGAVYESTDNYHIVDTGRYEMIMDLVEERHHPLVFFLWRHQRDELVKLAETRGLKYCVIDGNASSKERDDMVRHYQAGFYDVMFAHPKSAAHGLTLTRGSLIIWASPTYDLEAWMQGNARQARKGQLNKTEIIGILAEGTIEMKVYERLMEKNSRMFNLLNLFEGM